MDQSNYKEALERLQQDGFTASEIELLCQLRRDYQKQELDHISIDLHHLEFARWLVATGRLTDQLDAHQLPLSHESVAGETQHNPTSVS